MPNAEGPRGPRRPGRSGGKPGGHHSERAGPKGGADRRDRVTGENRRKAGAETPRGSASRADGAREQRSEKPTARAPGRANQRDGSPGKGPLTGRSARAARPAYGTAGNASRPARPPSGRPAAPAPKAPASDGSPREGDRIAKLLARAGIASRRDVERMIAEGRIARDGAVITTPATLLKSLHGVTVDGNPVKEPSPARLFLFHKPSGYLTAARDPRGRPTIYDRLPADLPRVMPVGRLDMTTEGLLLLTTDGGLKRQLELPSTGVERTYRARAFGEVSQAQLEELIDGVEIDGMRYGRIDANLERRTGRNQWIEMTITEGKNREVRRVLEYLGLTVNRLIRTRYGPFTLGESEPGEIVEVRQADLVSFRKTLKK